MHAKYRDIYISKYKKGRRQIYICDGLVNQFFCMDKNRKLETYYLYIEKERWHEPEVRKWESLFFKGSFYY